jgi:hypothetical protein
MKEDKDTYEMNHLIKMLQDIKTGTCVGLNLPKALLTICEELKFLREWMEFEFNED